MRLTLLCLTFFAAVSCSPVPEAPSEPPQPATEPVRADNHPGNTSLPTPDGVLPVATSHHPLRVNTASVAGVKLTFLSFDTRTHTLEVVDQPGIGSQYQSAAEAMRARGALAGINGGFFTPEGAPLGVVYHQGKKTGSLNTASSLGSGVLYVDRNATQPVLARRETFRKWLTDSTFQPMEVLQTGPFLIENGKAIGGLTNKEPRVRSLLLWDGDHHFALAQCEPITLRNLAGALAKQPLSGFRVQTALNLDGGRSSDLSISSKVTGGPLNLRRWWNKPVRNYVVVKPQ
jgi:uncharacterized protein YigE (DUF2233 family)